MRKTVWMRLIVVLAAMALLPFAPPGGFGGAGIAGAEPGDLAVSEYETIAIYNDYSSGDSVELYWEVRTEDEYELDVYLYRGEELLGSFEDYYYGEYEDEQKNKWWLTADSLIPGPYRLLLQLWDPQNSDDPADWLVYDFEVPERVPVTVYVFGTDDEIEDLQLVDTGNDETTPVPGSVRRISEEAKGYVYGFEVFPDRCFRLKSDNNYYFSIVYQLTPLCPEDGREFLVHASETPYLLQLFDYIFWEEHDGATPTLQGWIWFSTPGQFGLGVKIYGKEDVEGAGCVINDIYEGTPAVMILSCQLPDDPSHVEIVAIDGDGGEHTTNLVFRLDDVELPGNLTVTDRDGRLGWVEQEFRFEVREEDPARFALYRFVPLFTTEVRYAPVDGTGLRSAGPWEPVDVKVNSFDGSTFFQIVDLEGKLFAKTPEIPVVDRVSDVDGLLEYAASGIKPWDESFAPQHPSFKVGVNSAGGRSALIEWPLPDHGGLELIAYDLYYSDNNHNFSGADRVYLPLEQPSDTFMHRSDDIPEEVEKLVVVPILYNVDSSKLVYAREFEVMLEDQVQEPDPDAPKLASLTVNEVDLPTVSTEIQMFAPHGTESVPVSATADANVRITLDGNEYYGSVETEVPVTEDDFHMTITLYDPDSDLTTVYTVIIRRMRTAELTNQVLFGTLVKEGDEYEYRFVTKGMTAGALRERFVRDVSVTIGIMTEDEQFVQDGEEVPPGATVHLSRNAEFQIIQLRWLSDYLRDELDMGESEPVTLGHIALFVVRSRSDVTGDGKFDREDARLLLHESD
jgi:hypothetical protein